MPTDRLRSEREFHDRQAAERSASLAPDDYLVDDEQYLHHESWIAPAMRELGAAPGMRVLDLGCGHGMASVVLARQGARVVACDLSAGYLREARRRAERNAVQVDLVACDGERLPFADGAFDRIWGNAILHHLDLDRAAAEIARVLAPGGRAVVCEPWGGNRLLAFARQRLAYPGKARTADETPWSLRDLRRLQRHFPGLYARGHQLTAMLGRVVRDARLRAWLGRLDDAWLARLPAWQRYCRYVVVVLPK